MKKHKFGPALKSRLRAMLDRRTKGLALKLSSRSLIEEKAKGFTLIEIMVVVMIIALLAGIVVVQVNESRKRSRDAKRIADLATIRDALEMYAEAHDGGYPSVGGGSVHDNCGVNLKWIPDISPNYIPTVPSDPSCSLGMNYWYSSGGSNYWIRSHMESAEGLAKAAADGGHSPTLYELEN